MRWLLSKTDRQDQPRYYRAVSNQLLLNPPLFGAMQLRKSLKQQHRSAQSILAYRKAKREEDAIALAELIYDVFKEKKQGKNVIIIKDLNIAKRTSKH